MRLLFDHNVPAPLRRFLTQHDVTTAGERGWGGLTNGELLAVAERDGFQVFITSDKNLIYQQNLSKRRIAIVVLSTQQLAILQNGIGRLSDAIDQAHEGSFVQCDLPRPALVRNRPAS